MSTKRPSGLAPAAARGAAAAAPARGLRVGGISAYGLALIAFLLPFAGFLSGCNKDNSQVYRASGVRLATGFTIPDGALTERGSAGGASLGAVHVAAEPLLTGVVLAAVAGAGLLLLHARRRWVLSALMALVALVLLVAGLKHVSHEIAQPRLHPVDERADAGAVLCGLALVAAGALALLASRRRPRAGPVSEAPPEPGGAPG